MPKKLETVTGEMLMTMNLPPTRMIVRELLPQGLHILAGAPKTGKSWLTMQLCLQVAKGEPLWGLPTEKGIVLYLCLEDSLSRIQERMLDLTEHASQNIHFATMAETINSGALNQIEEFISEYPNTVLIAIDTLQRIRDVSGDTNAYANDYKEIGKLKQLADKHGIAILLVHHLRKQRDSDPFNMISGTTGMTGAVDGSYVLAKESRQSRRAKLIATGRDMPDLEYILEFDRDTHIWNFISNSSNDPFSATDKVITDIINYIKTVGNFVGTASELAESMKTDIRPNILAKKLIQNNSALFEAGIFLTNSRTGAKRELSLKYDPLDDSNDDNDDKINSGSVSNLPS